MAHPNRQQSLISMGVVTGTLVVPHSFDEGTLSRKDRLRSPMIAKERIVVAGRQLYAKGQKIRLADADRFGIVDGRLPKAGDERPKRRVQTTAKERTPDVENSADGGTGEQDDDGDTSGAAKQKPVRKKPGTRKRRGARRA